MHKILTCWAVVAFRSNAVTVRAAYQMTATLSCIIWLFVAQKVKLMEEWLSARVWVCLMSNPVLRWTGSSCWAPQAKDLAQQAQTHHTDHHVAYYIGKSWDIDISSWSVVDFSPIDGCKPPLELHRQQCWPDSCLLLLDDTALGQEKAWAVPWSMLRFHVLLFSFLSQIMDSGAWHLSSIHPWLGDVHSQV